MERLIPEEATASASSWWRAASGHAALLAGLVVYTAVGGLVFRELEHEAELARLETLALQVWGARQQLLVDLRNATRAEHEPLVARYEVVVQEAARGGLLVPLSGAAPPNTLARWTHMQAVFFASTVLTTIGYGNIAPSTVAGRLFCIAFALAGIPLTVSVLADLGGLLAGSLPRLPAGTGLCHSLATAAAATSILLLYIAAGAALFIAWEPEWTFFDAFYFCFVTMTTIGFGDLVPSTPQYMLLCTLYTLVGLSLTSSIIEVVRQQYSQSWRRLQALVEALGTLAAEQDLQSDLHLRDLLSSLARDQPQAHWQRAVHQLSVGLHKRRAKRQIVHVIVYESSV